MIPTQVIRKMMPKITPTTMNATSGEPESESDSDSGSRSVRENENSIISFPTEEICTSHPSGTTVLGAIS